MRVVPKGRGWLPVAIVAVALAGCGSGDGDDEGAFRVYSHQIPDMIRAEQLALDEADGRAGETRVELVALVEPPARDEREPAIRNANRAARDPRAVAYIGPQTSAQATAAIPILNRAGILTVSASATYVGLTQAEGALPGEPDRYYPTRRRTFGRVLPNTAREASAFLELMRREGARRVALLDDGSPYGAGLARAVRAQARKAGIRLVDVAPSEDPAQLARSIAAADGDGLLYATATGNPPELVRAFHQAEPELLVFIPGGSIGRGNAPALGDAEDVVHATAEVPADNAAAREFAKRYRERTGLEPHPLAYVAYETMKVVLEAIDRAEGAKDRRAAVVKAFFATRRRGTVLGDYAIEPDGDSTLTRYGAMRVEDGRLRPDGVLGEAEAVNGGR